MLVCAVSSACLAALLVPPASGVPGLTSADDLDTRQDRVERRIDRAHDLLEESSARARRASLRLLNARADLGRARTVVAGARADLAVAEAIDERLQARLEAAVARLRHARRELRAGHADVRRQRVRLRGLVASAYQQGDPELLGLSLVLTTQDPADLAGSLEASADVVNVHTGVLDRLEAAEVLLTVQEQQTESAQREVAQRRREAAENLRRTQALEAQASAAARQVELMVGAREAARTDALSAKQADLKALDALEAERARIETLIRERASRTAYDGPVHGGGYLDQPVPGSVTSPFGWRTHPIWGYRSLHDGVDFGAACGTPVRASADGTVLSTYFQSAWGNRVIIDHGVVKGVGLATISNHLTSWAVSPGQRVSRGQVIGYVGSTGWSTGCHLHFTVLQNGSAVDPMAWL